MEETRAAIMAARSQGLTTQAWDTWADRWLSGQDRTMASAIAAEHVAEEHLRGIRDPRADHVDVKSYLAAEARALDMLRASRLATKEG